MRILLAAALIGLGASVYFAPRHYEGRPKTPPGEGLVIGDPAERIRVGRENRALGVAFGGYQDSVSKDPSDMEAQRGLTRGGLLIGAAAFGQPQLEDLVRPVIDGFLEIREEADPDGAFLQKVLREWLDLRGKHHFWKSRVSILLYLAARGDDQAAKDLWGYVEKGPFHEEFFPYARRFQPAWTAVEPFVRHYLDKGDLSGRVHAGVTLLSYNHIYGEGAELLKRYRQAIRDALFESKTTMGPLGVTPVIAGRNRAALQGLAMLNEAAAARVLEKMRANDYPLYVDALRVAQIWAGVRPLAYYQAGGARWKELDSEDQEMCFRAAAWRYVRAKREGDEETLREAAAYVEEGLYHTEMTQLFCFRVLHATEPDRWSDLPQKMVAAGRLPAIYAAFLMPEGTDLVPILLPGVSSFLPDLSALGAVGLLDMKGPAPIQLP